MRTTYKSLGVKIETRECLVFHPQWVCNLMPHMSSPYRNGRYKWLHTGSSNKLTNMVPSFTYNEPCNTHYWANNEWGMTFRMTSMPLSISGRLFSSSPGLVPGSGPRLPFGVSSSSANDTWRFSKSAVNFYRVSSWFKSPEKWLKRSNYCILY